jgi:hypothetical protein
MTDREATCAVIDALTSLDIPYMLVGSYSVIYWSFARSTKDADFVIHLGERSLGALIGALGPAFRLDPQMSFETVTLTTKHELFVRDSPFRIELFDLSRDAHDQERFLRRVPAQLLGREIWLPSVEDVLITKARWARPKDIDDIRNVIAVQDGHIDWDYVHRWTDRHGTTALLDEIRRSIPPI